MSDIRFAVPTDLPAIREIWSAVFTADTVEERDVFLKTVHLHEECVLACVDGKPVSMAFFLPAVLHINSSAYVVRYLYAAATLPNYRGQGIFGGLLKTALQILRQRGVAACFLNPAQPSLVTFYQRFGFKPAFFSREVSGDANVRTLPIQPLSCKDYIALRQTLLPRDYVSWGNRLLTYAVSFATAVRIGDGCALFIKDGKILRVIELLGVSDTVCGALAGALDCDAFTARVFAETGDCFGMLLPLAEDIVLNTSPYMGLAFD